MIKRLRIKFVTINMTIVTLILCAIFAMVFHFTRRNLERENVRMMQTIALDPMRLGRPGELNPEIRLPYFVLQLGNNGEVMAVVGGYYDLSDREFLQKLIDKSCATETQIGVLEEYQLRFYRLDTPVSQNIVFSDMSTEIAMMKHLMRNCLLIGVISFLAFLTISILLARWAVRPVEQAWVQQRQFVADASHELKTPLTVILTNAELLKEEYDEQTKDRLSDHILTMSQQMKNLVESLLQLARVDSGIPKAVFSGVDLSELVSVAVLPFEPIFFEQELELDCEVQAGIRVKGSSAHLTQAVEILLDNARKYAFPGTRVCVALKRIGRHQCVLSVANQGSPLSAEELQNIFKRFYRADETRGRNGSFGLGLSIAEKIVHEHRGRIWAESEGGINTFFIRLPEICSANVHKT